MEIKDIIRKSIAEYLAVEVHKDSEILDLGAKIEIVEKRILKKIKLQTVPKDPAPKSYQYEMLFKSNPNDTIKLDGWIPIETSTIEKTDRIPEYIETGLLREIGT